MHPARNSHQAMRSSGRGGDLAGGFEFGGNRLINPQRGILSRGRRRTC